MQPSGGKDRIEPRVRATVRARLRDSQSERDICILNMSTRGFLATSVQPPMRGEFVELTIGCNKLTGQVRWASEHRFGVALRERVSVAILAEGGHRPAELASTPGATRRGSSFVTGLLGNPALLGRMGQFLALVAAIALAACLIVGFSRQSLAPVHEAVSRVNH